jgi:hypothetical protein
MNNDDTNISTLEMGVIAVGIWFLAGIVLALPAALLGLCAWLVWRVL